MKYFELFKQLDIELTEEKLSKLELYFELLVDWNTRMNLTGITEKDDVFLKHFYDSLTINKYIDQHSSLVDIGSGAGFPSVPLKIIRDDIEVVIIDSLAKRIKFLNEVINQLGLTNIRAIHGRAEECIKDYREYFDFATARAVARLNILSEFCIPYIKIGGTFISMKGNLSNEELDDAKSAFHKLGAKFNSRSDFNLPIEESQRTIVRVNKVSKTNNVYPRNFGNIKKNPL